MWQLIPDDFDVRLISEEGDRRLFAARRKKIWHFVKSMPGETSDPDNAFCNWDIAQAHIPRYSVAAAVKSLWEVNSLSRDTFTPEQRIVTSESEPVGIYSRGPNSYDINLSETPKGWPREVVAAIEEDIDLLECCREEIICQDGVFRIPNLTTPAGHPIESDCQSLVEAIAFENKALGTPTSNEISAFASFCVWRDLIVERGLPRSFFRQLVDNQFKYDASEFRGSPFLDLAMEVQSNVLASPIWGLWDDKPISLSPEDATEILVEGMSNLSSYQLTQFWLMDQLHGAGLFLPLAQVVGLNSWWRYAIWQTQEFQPDSPDEQWFRETTAFIKMLGDLTQES